MGSLIILLVVTLTAIVLSEYYASTRQSSEMLERYVDFYSLENPPGAGGPHEIPDDDHHRPKDEQIYNLSTFYSVAFADDGTVLAVDEGESGLYTRDELIASAQSLIDSGKTKGKEASFLYQISEHKEYTLVAFIDITVANSNLLTLTRHTLIAGGIAIVVLFITSLFLSRRIIQPLEENDQRQKQFVSDAGHELKTPISVMSTNIELLSRQIDHNEWLDNIRYENDRMGELITQLLDLSHVENAETIKEPVDLSRLTTGESLPFESVAFEHGLVLQTDIDGHIEVLGNSSQLSQLISILLDNAIRHSDGGKEINLSLTRQGHHAVLAIENSGKEIPGEQLSHLFERFYRIDNVRNSESKHYGLGLAIAKAITESHGGSISVSCHDGKVMFTITLPLKNC